MVSGQALGGMSGAQLVEYVGYASQSGVEIPTQSARACCLTNAAKFHSITHLQQSPDISGLTNKSWRVWMRYTALARTPVTA